MKKTLILIITILAAATFSNVAAQVTPPGAGDKDLRDTNVKGRSNELERIKRDAEKPEKRNKNKAAQNSNGSQPDDTLAAKYEEIKTDFEQIQQSQDSIISAYKSGEKIDYKQMSKFSLEINKSAVRLNSNLFPPTVVENSDAKKEEKIKKETKTPKSVRDIIVDLDNTIGSFATSPMFKNLRVVDPTVSEKTRLNLERIIELSGLLDAEARKMAATEK